MDPKKIVNQSEGILYMDQAWNKSTTPKPGYIAVKVRTTSYADGKIVRTALNDDGSELGDIDTVYDPERKKSWDDQQKQAQTQTDQAERKVVRTYTGTDPNTGRPAIITEYETGAPKYEEIKPGAPTARVAASVRYESRNGKQVKVTKYTDGTESTEEAAPAAAPGGTIVEQPDGVYLLKPDGTSIKTNLKSKPAPGSSSHVTMPDGSVVVITVAADGGVTTTEAIKAPSAGPPVPASATGWEPDMSKPDVGIFARRTEIQKMLSDGVFGDPASAAAQAKANALLKQDLDLANVTVNNVQGIQQGEAATYSGQVAQRGQDVSQADTRTNAATAIFNTGISELMKLMPYLPKGSHLAGAAIDALLERAYQFQVKMGGQNTPEQVQPGPYTTRQADIFKPGAAASQPITAPPPEAQGLPSNTIVQPGELPQSKPLSSFMPPPTGAPASATGVPAEASGITPPAPTVPPMRDNNQPRYPGNMPAPVYTPPAQTMDPGGTGPQPGDLPPSPVPAGQMPSPDMLAALQASPWFQSYMNQQAQPQQNPNQPMTMGLANQLGFSPEAIAAVFGQQGYQ